jgi:methylase of polypeptide subunit release factors
MPDVKNFEPKSALLSGPHGLDHYKKLFQQIKIILSDIDACSIFIEISPEQKNKLPKLVKKYLSGADMLFHKDLAGKWRVCQINI